MKIPRFPTLSPNVGLPILTNVRKPHMHYDRSYSEWVCGNYAARAWGATPVAAWAAWRTCVELVVYEDGRSVWRWVGKRPRQREEDRGRRNYPFNHIRHPQPRPPSYWHKQNNRKSNRNR